MNQTKEQLLRMALQLVRPPRLRLPNQSNDRHATWLELFYDLVFSVAISVLGSRLSTNVSPLHLVQFVALFLPVWWAWCGHTVYDTRFDNDDLFQRFVTFGMMLAAAGMAIFIPQAFEGKAAFFAASFVLARSCLLILYIRARYYVIEARPLTDLYLKGFGIGIGLWAISILTPSPFCYILWALGLVIDLATPWLGLRNVLRSAPLDTTHLPERFGSFTIIVLGEIVYVIITGVAASNAQPLSLVAAALAFCVTICIWWTYFTFLDKAPFKNRLGTGTPYMYTHLLVLVGITIIGIGLGRAVQEAIHPALTAETRGLLSIGVIIWMFAGMALKLVSIGYLTFHLLLLRMLIIGSIVAIMTIGAYIPPLVLLGAFFVVMITYVLFEMRYWNKTTQESAIKDDSNGA
jgi:low temperature requirement protein LtrA